MLCSLSQLVTVFDVIFNNRTKYCSNCHCIVLIIAVIQQPLLRNRQLQLYLISLCAVTICKGKMLHHSCLSLEFYIGGITAMSIGEQFMQKGRVLFSQGRTQKIFDAMQNQQLAFSMWVDFNQIRIPHSNFEQFGL